MNSKREYKYVGPERQLPRPARYDCPLSPENALGTIQKAWREGRIHSGRHFKTRCNERKVDLMDLENLVWCGRVIGNGERCPDYNNWKYRIAGLIDERHLEVIVALDPVEDLSEMPIAILITVYERKPRSSP